MQNATMPDATNRQIGRTLITAVSDARKRDPIAFQREREAFAMECYGMSWADAQRVPAEEAAEIVARWMARVLGCGKGAA